ncbi:MAG: holo-ACP synthase [Deltaproteobacteria bacterium]|nr:holo-ACP synthase [Deltaproteobacteria bacterium]
MSDGVRTLGVGVDLVHVPGLREQLADAASGFAAATFTRAEVLASEARPGHDPARHLAARFAAKEAAVKAWSSSRWGQAPTMERADLREIEVVADAWGRPQLRFHGSVRAALGALGVEAAHVSLSHDGDHAIAFVSLEGR